MVFLLCALSVIVGIVIGSIAVSDPLLNHWRVSQNLIDRNIHSATSPERALLGFVFSRAFDIFLAGLLMFFMSLTIFTKWLVFPYLAMQGYWVVVNIFWIFARFGVSGTILAIIYVIVFIILLKILIALAVFVLRFGRDCRLYGFRSRVPGTWRTAVWFLVTAAFLGLFEGLMYFLILSRMVFPPG